MRNSITFFLIWKMFMQNRLSIYLNWKRIMQNGILGISVGAYCICPYRMSPKETYDQKSRYMWGLCNTPLPWRKEGSISKIDFLVMRNSITFFLIWKMVMQNCMTFFLNRKIIMQNRLYLYWNRERVMQNVLTFYLNRERVMQNSTTLFLI